MFIPNKTKWAKNSTPIQTSPARGKKKHFVCVVNTVGLHKGESQEIRAGHVTLVLPSRLPPLPSPSLHRKNLGTASSMSQQTMTSLPTGILKSNFLKFYQAEIGKVSNDDGSKQFEATYVEKKKSNSQSTMLISYEWQKWQKGPCTSLNRAAFPEQKLHYSIDWWLLSIQAVPSFVLSVTDLGFPLLKTRQNNQRDLLHTFSHETWTDNIISEQ